MRTATITRRRPKPGDKFGTLAKLVTDKGTELAHLEKAWAGNAKDVSCIPPAPDAPPAKYILKWGWSEHHKRNLYIYQDVPDRTMCEEHSANVEQQLLGCGAPGLTVASFPEGFVYNKETGASLEEPQLGVAQSVAAVAKFEADYLEDGKQADIEVTVCWG